MTTMGKQQVFDKVATHLLTQNEASETADGPSTVCAYRGDTGLKCAAGILIKDEHYSPDLERCGVSDPDVMNALLLSGVDRSAIGLVLNLQSIHDWLTVSSWSRELLELATREGLSADIVNNYEREHP